MLLETTDRRQNEISSSDSVAEQCSSGAGAAANSLLLWGLLGMCDKKGFTYISNLSLSLPLRQGLSPPACSQVRRILVCYTKNCSCNKRKIFAYGKNREVIVKMDSILQPDLCSLPLHTVFEAAGATFSENINSHYSLGSLMTYKDQLFYELN